MGPRSTGRSSNLPLWNVAPARTMKSLGIRASEVVHCEDWRAVARLVVITRRTFDRRQANATDLRPC
jgi:hypothetical protein